MITEQEQYTCVQTQRLIQDQTAFFEIEPVSPQFSTPEFDHSRLFEFAANAPATLAERHPHLAVLAVSAAVLLAAIAAEIDCLSGSGYFWR